MSRGELFITGGLLDKQQETGYEVNLLNTVKVEIEKLWDRAIAYLDQAHRVHMNAQSTDARDSNPGNTTSPITAADLEHLVHRIAREQAYGIRVDNRGRAGPPKWLNKLLLAVAAALIVGAISTTATTIVLVASIHTKVDAYIESNNKRLDTDEQEIHDTTKRLDRGATP
jgi:hypothetical protein